MLAKLLATYSRRIGEQALFNNLPSTLYNSQSEIATISPQKQLASLRQDAKNIVQRRRSLSLGQRELPSSSNHQIARSETLNLPRKMRSICRSPKSASATRTNCVSCERHSKISPFNSTVLLFTVDILVESVRPPRFSIGDGKFCEWAASWRASSRQILIRFCTSREEFTLILALESYKEE